MQHAWNDVYWCDCSKHAGAGLTLLRQDNMQEVGCGKTVLGLDRRPWGFSKSWGSPCPKHQHHVVHRLMQSCLLPVTGEHAVMAAASPTAM